MQCRIEGYSRPFRLNQNTYVGGAIVYVRKNVPQKLIVMYNCLIEAFFLELNLIKNKWFTCCSFNSHHFHLASLGINLDLLSGN